MNRELKNTEETMYDVVTLGETMLRLVPPNYERLEQARSYDVTAGGSESNVAVGLARLGLRTAWISKLPQNPMGRFIANKIREHGVDTSHIVWVKEGRVGIYFVEFGSSPRPSQVIYDRKNSAISTLTAEEVDWESIFKETRHFHTSGITTALSQSCADAVEKAILKAKDMGLIISFDINYRSKLWPPESARKCLSKILKHVNILFTGVDDAKLIFGFSGNNEDIADQLKTSFNLDVVAMTTGFPRSVRTGVFSSIVLTDKVYYGKSYEMEVVDRLGSGDSFTAGFLYGYMTGDIQKALDYGNAMGALKNTFPGDISWVTEEDILNQLKSQEAGVRR